MSILHWSTVYTTSWTPWSLLSEVRKNGPQRQRVLSPVDGGGGDGDGDSGGDGSSGGGGNGGGDSGGDVLLLFPRYPLCGT